MSTLITINVKNMGSEPHGFYFFQKPAIYHGGPNPYTNSLYNAQLAPFEKSGAIVTFQVNMQFYAGVQETKNRVPPIGTSSGFLSASQPIDITPKSGATKNTTSMSVHPLGLSASTHTTGVPSGSFRIVAPTYDSNTSHYFAGAAVNMQNGGIVLSSYVLASPNQTIDAEPILTFYVQTGDYTPGSAFNFTQTSVTAAVCDATGGFKNFEVAYDSKGHWHVTPS